MRIHCALWAAPPARALLLPLALLVTLCGITAAARLPPASPGGHARTSAGGGVATWRLSARRLLDSLMIGTGTSLAGLAAGSGGSPFGGGFCSGPYCDDRMMVQTLATIGAQDAVRRAVDAAETPSAVLGTQPPPPLDGWTSSAAGGFAAGGARQQVAAAGDRRTKAPDNPPSGRGQAAAPVKGAVVARVSGNSTDVNGKALQNAQRNVTAPGAPLSSTQGRVARKQGGK